MKRRLWAVAAVAVVSGLFAAAYTWRSGPAGAAVASGGDRPRTTVSARGRLEPESEVIEVGAAPGDRIAQIVVAEGARVRRGDPLAYLESNQERSSERDYSARQLAEGRARLEAENRHGESLIGEARIHLRQLETVPDLEVEEQQALVDAAVAELARSRADLARTKALADDGLTTPQALEHLVLEVQQNEARLRSSEATLRRLKTDRSVALDMAREQLRTAEAALARSRSLVQIDSLEAALRLAESRLERTIIRAPLDGQILKVLMHSGETTGQGPMLTMGNTERMYVVAEVYETDVVYVRSGQKVRVTAAALPQPLSGVVDTVGRSIHKTRVLDIDPAADTDSRVVEVRIRLDESGAVAALTNLQVRVDIEISAAERH